MSITATFDNHFQVDFETYFSFKMTFKCLKKWLYCPWFLLAWGGDSELVPSLGIAAPMDCDALLKPYKENALYYIGF